MRRRLTRLYLVLFLLLASSTANGQAATVYGVVQYRQGTPMPGVTVYLVHPTVGRSAPSVTDPFGRYVFSNVPRRSDPYYLEVYWGRQLMYRKTVLVTIPLLTLPPILL